MDKERILVDKETRLLAIESTKSMRKLYDEAVVYYEQALDSKRQELVMRQVDHADQLSKKQSLEVFFSIRKWWNFSLG